jgi:hypothetical protein
MEAAPELMPMLHPPGHTIMTAIVRAMLYHAVIYSNISPKTPALPPTHRLKISLPKLFKLFRTQHSYGTITISFEL